METSTRYWILCHKKVLMVVIIVARVVKIVVTKAVASVAEVTPIVKAVVIVVVVVKVLTLASNSIYFNGGSYDSRCKLALVPPVEAKVEKKVTRKEKIKP